MRSLLAWSRKLNTGAADDRSTVVAGALRVDLGSNRASWRDEDLGLSYCEFELLRALAARPGRVVTYEELCDALGSRVADNTIATHVQNIRNKFTRLDAAFPRAEAIRAVPRRGYAWETPSAPT